MQSSRGPRDSIAQDVIDGLAKIGVGDIGHIQRVGFMNPEIRPVWRDIRLIGRATTARMMNMDLTVPAVIEAATPGDVIVVDRGGEHRVACWGGFSAILEKTNGVAGLIVDGAVTDSMEITDLRWPVYSRTVSGLVGNDVNVEVPSLGGKAYVLGR